MTASSATASSATASSAVLVRRRLSQRHLRQVFQRAPVLEHAANRLAPLLLVEQLPHIVAVAGVAQDCFDLIGDFSVGDFDALALGDFPQHVGPLQPLLHLRPRVVVNLLGRHGLPQQELLVLLDRHTSLPEILLPLLDVVLQLMVHDDGGHLDSGALNHLGEGLLLVFGVHPPLFLRH